MRLRCGYPDRSSPSRLQFMFSLGMRGYHHIVSYINIGQLYLLLGDVKNLGSCTTSLFTSRNVFFAFGKGLCLCALCWWAGCSVPCRCFVVHKIFKVAMNEPEIQMTLIRWKLPLNIAFSHRRLPLSALSGIGLWFSGYFPKSSAIVQAMISTLITMAW